MGSADIVPGVSGGTMALILEIYERFINAIKSVNVKFLKYVFTFRLKDAIEQIHYRFLIFLMAGIFTAIFFFTKVVPLQVYMFTNPEIVYGLFFGLILGSIYILYKTLEKHTWIELLFTVIGAGIGFWIVNLVPTDTPEHPIFIFMSGMVAICAMVLPGISGSYILLILRKYEFVLSQIGKLGTSETLDGILTLLPFILGALVGLAAFSRFLSWLLNRYHSKTLGILIGFLIGSLFVIWPFQNRSFVEQVRETEVLSYSDERVQELLTNGGNENLPEFERLGAILNEDAQQDEPKMVEVQTVKKKLIKSDPFIPYITKNDPSQVEGSTIPVSEGFVAIFIGTFLVMGIEQLRKKK